MAGKRPVKGVTHAPGKIGRPSSYTEALAEEICERLSRGEPLARICDDDHMPAFGTVWRWERDNEAFRELSQRAREIGTHYLADDSLRISDDPEIDPQHKRIMVDTRLRLIGKWNAKKYGDKVQTEISGPDGGAIPVDDTAMAARMAALLALAAHRKGADEGE